MRVAKVIIWVHLDPDISIRNQIGDEDLAHRKLLEVGLSLKDALKSDPIASKHRDTDVAIFTEGARFRHATIVVPMGRPIRHQSIERAAFNPLGGCRRGGHYCWGDCFARTK